MIYAVKVVKNNKDEYNLTFLKDGKWNFLYDHTNIRESVKKEISNINLDNIKTVVLIGVGLGYHLVDLINIHTNKKIKFIAIEPFNLFSKAANALFNLEKTLKVHPYVRYINLKRDGLSNVKDLKRLHLQLKKTKFVIPDVYLKFFPNEVKKIIEEINAIAIEDARTLGNSVDDSILGVYNMFRNAQSITQSLPLGILKDYYKSYPAVIVSAGPSLNKNIDVLKENQDKVIVIATDATFKVLIDKGIRVDFVLILERDYVTYEKFFKNTQYDNIPTLVYQSVVWPDVAATFKNSKIVTFKNKLPTEYKFGGFLGDNYNALSSGSSVAVMAISFAHFIGSNLIILIGQDLAYSEDGVTHADGVTIKKKENLDNAIEVDGIDGKKVKTTATWRMFKLQIENLIREYDLNVIDATEGGALIRGTKIATLKETLSNLPNLKISYDFKNYKISKSEVFSKILNYKDLLVEQIEKSIDVLKDLKNMNTDNWNEFVKRYSEAEQSFYFSHFHSMNTRLLLYYHNNDQNDRIYNLLSGIIESSKVLIEYINEGFKIGKEYKKLLSIARENISGDFGRDLKNLEFLISNRMPYKALNFVNKMETFYPKRLQEIYKYKFSIYSNFIIEKIYNPENTLSYGFYLIKNDYSLKQDLEFVSTLKKAASTYFDNIILSANVRNYPLVNYKNKIERILKISFIIGDIDTQCKVSKYLSDDLDTLELQIAKYNCLIHENLKDEAKEHLINALKKYPNNPILLKELKKYSDS